MPIMEATLTQEYFGQITQTRFNYLASGTPAAVTFSFGLVSAMGAVYDPLGVPAGYPNTGLMARIAQVQNDQVTFLGLAIRDVYSNTDFFEQVFVEPLIGEAAGTIPSSPVLSYGFKTNRTRSDIRPGQKRFVGVDDGFTSPGGVISPGFFAGQINALAVKMAEILTYEDQGNTLSYEPIIVGKEKYEVPGSNPIRHAYRYYEAGEAAQLQHIMQSITWTPKERVRTQTSRQYGRGQ